MVACIAAVAVGAFFFMKRGSPAGVDVEELNAVQHESPQEMETKLERYQQAAQAYQADLRKGGEWEQNNLDD